MIGKLSGRLEYRADDHVMIDVEGVGYIVYCSDRTMAALPEPGGSCALFTEMVVREDLMQLFGFMSLIEKEWHRLLMTVQGVGAKAALAILGALGAEGVSQAIALGDWTAIKAAKGIGPKIAQRVVLDLKDKAPALMAMGGGAAERRLTPPASGSVTVPASGAGGNAQADALSALANLGYGPSDAAAAVAQAARDEEEPDASELIRAALRILGPKG